MSIQKLLYFLLLIGFLSPQTVSAQNKNSLGKVITELTSTLDDSNPTLRPMRLAVMAPLTTGTIFDDQNNFGNYLAEKIISNVKTNSKKFRLFERSRLDALLSEHAFAQSGLINKEAALKLGELAPIDVILSGTFTKLKSYISINLRLIDVLTGEILTGFEKNIILTKDLLELFPETSSNQQKLTKKERCKQIRDKFLVQLKDLRTEEKINKIVENSIRFPFDLECGKFHFDIIYSFKKHNILNDDYNTFLLNSLEQIDFPGDDFRAKTIFQYFNLDGELDDDEWEAGLKVLQKTNLRSISTHLRYLVNFDTENLDISLSQERITEFFEEVDDGKVGVPNSITMGEAFQETLDAFNYLYAKDNEIFFWLYDKYFEDIVSNPDNDKMKISLLEKMYWREKESKQRTQILSRLQDQYNSQPMVEKQADKLYSLLKKMETVGKGKYKREGEIAAPDKDIKAFTQAVSAKLCEGLKLAKFRSSKEDRELLCLKYEISCDALPTFSEIEQMLIGDDGHEKIRAAELLSNMGPGALKAEKIIIGALKQNRNNYDTNSSVALKHLISALGNIKSQNKEGIKLLADLFSSTLYKVPYAAEEALVKIGKPAVPILIEKMKNDRFGGVQYKAVHTLGQIGKDARQALPELKKLVETSKNSAVHSAAVQAVNSIER